jgi:hypothetical protein
LISVPQPGGFSTSVVVVVVTVDVSLPPDPRTVVYVMVVTSWRPLGNFLDLVTVGMCMVVMESDERYEIGG